MMTTIEISVPKSHYSEALERWLRKRGFKTVSVGGGSYEFEGKVEHDFLAALKTAFGTEVADACAITDVEDMLKEVE